MKTRNNLRDSPDEERVSLSGNTQKAHSQTRTAEQDIQVNQMV